MDQVSVGSMELHGIKPRLSGPAGRPSEVLNDPADLFMA